MSGALVIAGVVVLAFSCLGVLIMRGALARLHYVSVSTLGVVLVVAAFLVATAPVLAHVTARTIHGRAQRRR